MARKQMDTAGKTENFFTRNVKLITFLICIAVIFSPFVIAYVKDYIEEHREDPRPEMTVDDLAVIARKGDDLCMSDLDAFEGERIDNDMQGMTYVMYRIHVTDRFVLSASFDGTQDYIFYLNLMDLDKKTELDLLKEADKLEAFVCAPVD